MLLTLLGMKPRSADSVTVLYVSWSPKFRRPCYIHNSWRVIYHSTTHSFNLQEVRPSARLGGITLKFASNYTSFVFSSKKKSCRFNRRWPIFTTLNTTKKNCTLFKLIQPYSNLLWSLWVTLQRKIKTWAWGKKVQFITENFSKKKISRFIFCFDIKFLSRDLILRELISGKMFKFKFSPVQQNLSGKFGCPVLSSQETHMPSLVEP